MLSEDATQSQTFEGLATSLHHYFSRQDHFKVGTALVPNFNYYVIFYQLYTLLFYLPPGSPEGDYNLHHVRVCVRACVRACVCHAVFSETTTVTQFW